MSHVQPLGGGIGKHIQYIAPLFLGKGGILQGPESLMPLPVFLPFRFNALKGILSHGNSLHNIGLSYTPGRSVSRLPKEAEPVIIGPLFLVLK
jgi:hypothetical protein